MRALGIAEVVESKAENLKVGQLVSVCASSRIELGSPLNRGDGKRYQVTKKCDFVRKPCRRWALHCMQDRANGTYRQYLAGQSTQSSPPLNVDPFSPTRKLEFDLRTSSGPSGVLALLHTTA